MIEPPHPLDVTFERAEGALARLKGGTRLDCPYFCERGAARDEWMEGLTWANALNADERIAELAVLTRAMEVRR